MLLSKNIYVVILLTKMHTFWLIIRKLERRFIVTGLYVLIKFMSEEEYGKWVSKNKTGSNGSIG